MTKEFEIVKERTVNGIREARWGGTGTWKVIDDETGLPRIGKDQFWRVTSPRNGSDYMGVELRQNWPPKKKKTWWGKMVEEPQPSSVLGSAYVDVSSSDFTAHSVLESALYVLRAVDKTTSKDDLLRKLVGDYPPKSLKEDLNGD